MRYYRCNAHRDIGRDTDIKEALDILEISQRKEFIDNGKLMLENEDINFKGTLVKEKKFLGIF